MITDETISFFYRHIVPMVFIFQKGDESYHAQISTFVISIKENWFLVTAGHCLRDVEVNLERGYRIKRCGLADSLGINPQDHFYIPFVYSDRKNIIIEDYGLDIGLIFLSEYYKGLLQANNIVALNEEVWKHQPEDPDFFFLVGMPDLLIEKAQQGLIFHPAFCLIEKIESKPEGFEEVEIPRFYGRMSQDEIIDDIKGISGSPIFAFKKDNQGQLKYWLTAVECSWLNESKYISGCYIKDVAKAIWDKLE